MDLIENILFTAFAVSLSISGILQLHDIEEYQIENELESLNLSYEENINYCLKNQNFILYTNSGIIIICERMAEEIEIEKRIQDLEEDKLKDQSYICEEYASATHITKSYPDRIYSFNNITISEKYLFELCKS